MTPAPRYILACYHSSPDGDPRTLVESHVTLASALQALQAHADRPWDAIFLTTGLPLRTQTGRELLAGGRLQ